MCCVYRSCFIFGRTIKGVKTSSLMRIMLRAFGCTHVVFAHQVSANAALY